MTQPTRRQLANAIRFLAADAVEAAKSGHPGMPMGMADIAEVLWNDFFRHNPNNPQWFNRDRFVLSNGHGSMLQYALLHLSGYDLPIEQLKQFRQLHSKTAGHPERSETPASRPPPVRSVRALPMRSGSRWPRSCWRSASTARSWKSSTTAPGCSWAMAA